MNFRIIKDELYFNRKSLRANPTKWSNILKQFAGKLLKKGLKFSHPKRLHFLASSRSPNKIYKYKIYKLRFVETVNHFKKSKRKKLLTCMTLIQRCFNFSLSACRYQHLIEITFHENNWENMFMVCNIGIWTIP